jgi:hypothetical protein
MPVRAEVCRISAANVLDIKIHPNVSGADVQHVGRAVRRVVVVEGTKIQIELVHLLFELCVRGIRVIGLGQISSAVENYRYVDNLRWLYFSRRTKIQRQRYRLRRRAALRRIVAATSEMSLHG